jgi:hypothetical protein
MRIKIIVACTNVIVRENLAIHVAAESARLVYELTEDAMLGDYFMRFTTRKLIAGKWRSNTRKAKIAEYHKDK